MPPIYPLAGAVAGGTLGYITNNLPGAYYGSILGYQAGKAKTMPYKTRKRKSKYKEPSKKRRRTSSSNSSRRTVTRQHDLRTTFKNRKPSRRVQRLKKFAKRVKAAQNLKLPLQTLVEATGDRTPDPLRILQFPTATHNSQNLFDSDATTAMRDFRIGQNTSTQGFQPFINALRTVPLNESGTNVPMRSATTVDDIKFTLQTRMNIVFKNPQDISLLVDVYECVAVQDISDSNYWTAEKAFRTSLLNCETMNGAGNSYTLLDPDLSGVTPFDVPNFRNYWKILDKQRFLITAGSDVSMTFNTPKLKMNLAKWTDKQVKKGITKDLIVIANPTYGGETAGNGEILNMQWTKSHHVRVPDFNVGTQLSFAGKFNVVDP